MLDVYYNNIRVNAFMCSLQVYNNGLHDYASILGNNVLVRICSFLVLKLQYNQNTI